MTTTKDALDALRTHIQAIQVAGVDVWSGADAKARGVVVVRDGVDPILARPCVLIFARESRPYEPHSNRLHYVTIGATIMVDAPGQGGVKGSGALYGGHGRLGIEQIRAAIVSACDVIGPRSSPPIAPSLVLQSSDAPYEMDPQTLALTITWEGMLEL